MSTLIGRWLTATKNADGTLMLEFAQGNFPFSINRIVMTLTTAEVTALSNVISGGGSTTASHKSENAGQGNFDH